jgi:hypothetical protein
MTFAPPTIVDLQRLYVAHGGVGLGIVGDTGHVSTGTSYHLGKSQLTATAYSRVLPRDKAGLSEAASAIDLGAIDGSLAKLQAFSRWLVAECQKDRDGFAHDVREVIFSPDGKVVHRWSGPDNKVYDVPLDTANNRGHLTHTHISFYRDSEFRSKVALFAPYWESVVESKPVYENPVVMPVKSGAWLYWYSDLRDDARNVRLDGRTADQLRLPHVLTYTQPKDRTVWPWLAGVFMVAYEPLAGDTNTTSRGMFLRSEDLSAKPEPVPPPSAPEPPPPTTPTTVKPVTVTVSQDGKVLNELVVQPNAG